VAGGVDDVDFGAGKLDGGVFCQDGDAALFFKLVRIHDALGDGLVGAEGASLAQKRIDEGGLSVIDVGNDGDVADRCAQSAMVFLCNGRAGGYPPPPKQLFFC
jgi:hypothetical protein